MATTLSFGYTKPQDGDKGQQLFDALEANWQQVNDHNHEGTNSAKLGSAALNHTSQALANSNWSSVGNGIFRQVVSTVGGLSYENYEVVFRNSANGDRLFLDTEKISTSQFYVYCNDSSVDLTVIYV
jgi:hypothetical protein